jgi:hypothetical protein
MRTLAALSALCLTAAPAMAGGTSQYVAFDLDKCQLTEKPDEYVFEGAWRCKGLAGYDMFFGGFDARNLAGFGKSADNNCAYLKTFNGFNSMLSPVEFRFRGKTPVAAIQRWSVVADPETPEKSITWLVVNKLANGTSCQMHFVAGSYPKANERAREVADTLAEGFDCETAAPGYSSEIGPPDINLEPCSTLARE